MTIIFFGQVPCKVSISERMIISLRFKLKGRILHYRKLYARIGPRCLAKLVGHLEVGKR